MGQLIGVYPSQQDLVSDNLGPLCTWKCRLVVKLWRTLKGRREGFVNSLWPGWAERLCLFRIPSRSSKTLGRAEEVKFPKALCIFVGVSG